jgi:hypothetical protein
MEDADAISLIITQLNNAQVPDKMPDVVRDAIRSAPTEQRIGLNQYIDMTEKSALPRNREHGFGLVSLYKSFLKGKLPMLEDAILMEGPGKGKTLADFL